MTDSTVQQVGKKSPLDILEDVLEDAKGASKVKNADKVDKEKKQRAELDLIRKQKIVEEKQLIQEQLAKMQEVNQMPAEKTRKAQSKTEKVEIEKQKSSREGYRIQQLKRTKT